MRTKNIAIFASGQGSNAVNLIQYFQNSSEKKIAFVLCNNQEAPIVDKCRELGMEIVLVTNQEIEKPNFLIELCQTRKIDFIVLAGFLRKIPEDFVQVFDKKIINIHPSLLPKYGGTGMYGKHVHLAVLENKEREHGITIHFVNQEYDKGEIITQHSCLLDATDDLASTQAKINKLELEFFPKVIEKL